MNKKQSFFIGRAVEPGFAGYYCPKDQSPLTEVTPFLLVVDKFATLKSPNWRFSFEGMVAKDTQNNHFFIFLRNAPGL